MATNLNTISCNNKQAHDVVMACVKARQPVLIHGAPGIGKSQMIKQIANELGRELTDLRLAQFPPEDLAGLPVADKRFYNKVDADGNKVKSEKYKYKTMRSMPDYLPTKGTGILFLDEINQANQSVLNAVFQLVLDGELAGGAYKLPEEWCIVAACNDPEFNPDVTEFSSPINDRFIHVKMNCDKKVWLSWAKTNKIHTRVIDFIDKMQLNFLCDTGDNMSENIVFTSPRSWERVSAFEYQFDNKELNKTTLQILLSGIIGIEYTNQYLEATENSRFNTLEEKLGFDTKPYEDFLYKGDTTATIKKSPFDSTIDKNIHLDRLLLVKQNTKEDKKKAQHALFMMVKYGFEVLENKSEQIETLIQNVYGKDFKSLHDVHKDNEELWEYIMDTISKQEDFLNKCKE